MNHRRHLPAPTAHPGRASNHQLQDITLSQHAGGRHCPTSAFFTARPRLPDGACLRPPPQRCMPGCAAMAERKPVRSWLLTSPTAAGEWGRKMVLVLPDTPTSCGHAQGAGWLRKKAGVAAERPWAASTAQTGAKAASC